MRAKLINETISFERGSDPKSALGIGLYSHRVLNNRDELVEYLMAALTEIFDGQVPEDILSRLVGGVIPWPYYYKITQFLEEKSNKYYLDYKGKKSNDWGYLTSDRFAMWPGELKSRLIQLGYEE